MLHDFQNVERIIPVIDKPDRLENDAEHSYTLTMFAWFLIDSVGLDMNKDLVIKYCLVHDLVETYAGDTYIFDTDEKKKNEKHDREEKARMKIKKQFPEFREMNDLIQNYENKSDEESRFVYALDKVIPAMTNYLNRGEGRGGFKKMGLTLDMLKEYKKDKVSAHPDVEKLWDEFLHLLEEDESNLFG